MSTLVSPSLGKLLTNVRNFLNQTNASNSFWTDQELTEYINEAIRMYFAEVVQNLEGHFTTTATLDVVANTETVDLPTDFFEMRALYIQRNDGYDILAYQNNITAGYDTNTGSGSLLFRPYYFFRGNKIVLRPVPNFSQTALLKVEYIQFPDQLINGGDTLSNQISPVFKQLIEMYAVYKAKLKESSVNGVNMHSVPKENLNEIYLQFQNAINKRSKYPEFIQPYNPEGY